MTAEEMFKELGFRKCDGVYREGETLLYEKSICNDRDVLMVRFLYGKVRVTELANYVYNIDGKLMKAIYKQMEELGWLEEKTCTNLSEYDSTEEFKCSNCGFTLVEHKEYAVGEDDGEEYHFNYKPKYCPNCGRKIID